MDNIQKKCLDIAKSLPEWFTNIAIQNIKIDLEINNILYDENLDGYKKRISKKRNRIEANTSISFESKKIKC